MYRGNGVVQKDMAKNINEEIPNTKGKFSRTVIPGHKLAKAVELDPAKHDTQAKAIEFVIVKDHSYDP